MDTFCWLGYKLHNSDSCQFLIILIQRRKGREMCRCFGVSSHREASLELILSDSMCNECEFFGLDSDEDVCLLLVFVVSSPLVASCDSASCDENL